MPGGEARRWRVPALLFALVWLSCVWFGSWALNPNSATRLLAATAADELMLVCDIFDPALRLRALDLAVAARDALTPRP